MNNIVVKCKECGNPCNKHRFEGLCKRCFKTPDKIVKLVNRKKIRGMFYNLSKGIYNR